MKSYCFKSALRLGDDSKKKKKVFYFTELYFMLFHGWVHQMLHILFFFFPVFPCCSSVLRIISINVQGSSLIPTANYYLIDFF